MTMSDPLGDMITRIRNGQMAGKGRVRVPKSKLRANVLNVLKDEGFITGYDVETNNAGHEDIIVELKYYEGQPVIKRMKRMSKPGRRLYSGSQSMPRISNGLGMVIVSTPKGVMSDHEARKQNVGGEVLVEVF